MRGVWILYATDWSSITPFSSEIEAVRANIAKPDMKVGFAVFGATFGGKVLPAERPPKKESSAS